MRRNELWSYVALAALFVLLAGGVYLWREASHQADEAARKTEENDSLRQLNGALTKERDDTQLELARLTGRIDEQRRVIEQLRRDLNEATKERDELDKRAENLQRQIERFQEEVSKQKSNNAELQRDLRNTKTLLREANARKDRLQAELDRKTEDTFSAVEKALGAASRPHDSLGGVDAGRPAPAPSLAPQQ